MPSKAVRGNHKKYSSTKPLEAGARSVCKDHTLENLWAFQESGAGKAARASGGRCWGSGTCCRSWTWRSYCFASWWRSAHAQELEQQRHLNRKANLFPSAMSRQCALLTKLNIMPVNKGKIFNGPRSMFKEQEKRLDLELRSKNSITGKAYISYHCNTTKGSCMGCINPDLLKSKSILLHHLHRVPTTDREEIEHYQCFLFKLLYIAKLNMLS